MASINSRLESRPLKRPRLGPPDVYPQDPKQKEDELTSVNVKQGFINQLPFSGENGEYGTAKQYMFDSAKITKSFSNILVQKQLNSTFTDNGKKRPPLTKDNFWLIAVSKNRIHLQQWIKELRGNKSLSSLGRRVPIYSKKEEVFQVLADNQITILRATWYIKMTAAYSVIQMEAKNKKNRITVDLNPEWTGAVCKFIRDQIATLLDDPSLGNANSGSIQIMMQQTKEDTERNFNYMCRLAHHMFVEGMLDRHEFLSWFVETLERIRLHGTHALSFVMPLLIKYIQEIVKSQLLSRRTAYVTCRLLHWLLNENSWGCSTPVPESPSGPHSVSSGPPSVSSQQQRSKQAPPTPGQPNKPQSPQKGQPSSPVSKTFPLPHNFPPFLVDIAYGLVGAVQCVALECPGALVWYPPDDPKSPGSPLDYLPAAPSALPLPNPPESDFEAVEEDKMLRSALKEQETEIMQRSFAAEMRWSSDKCQESAAGHTINRVLSTLKALDKQQNFDRTDPIEPLYSKIFPQNNNKDTADQSNNNGEEAVIWLLCEWAISAKRLGEHRAAVVAKLLDKRQMQLENERAVEIAELLRAKALSLTGNISRDGSAGISANVLTPPQLLVEGVDPNQQENAVPPAMLPSSSELMNTHPFQNLLFSFLDTQAPVLDDPNNKEELQAFKNLVVLFSELIQNDVFSHDQYVSTLISRGDIIPGQISPLPIFISSANSNSFTTHGSHTRVGISSVGPSSTGPVSNKALDGMMKVEIDDDLPSSVRSTDQKNDSTDLGLFSPELFLQSPDRPVLERHFTDAMRSDKNGKDKTSNFIGNSGSFQAQNKKPTGPIWGFKQLHHVQYLMHFPIVFEDDSAIHESNQRLMVLYGAGRQRNEVKKAVKKITKYVCKLVQKLSITATDNPGSVGIPSVGEGRKSRRLAETSPPPNPEILIKKFRCLSYFDQHMVTYQAVKAINGCYNEYISGSSQNLPHKENITLVLNLMEEALNFGGMVQLAVQIISLLVPLEAEIDRRHPYLKACYTKDLALNMVAVLRHYQSYLTLNVDLTLQAFDAMHAFIKQSKITNPGDCTSSDRCMLLFMFHLYTTFPYRSKHLMETFGGFASAIKQTLCEPKKPATSNYRYDNMFLAEYIQHSTSIHPLVIARQNSHLLREASSFNRYSFVCSAIITMCSGQPNPESLNVTATLCAEMNAQCNDLSSEWLGVLKALCCSSCTANFNDVRLSVDPGDVMIPDPLAMFTAILIARNCLSLEDFIQHVAIPSLLAACPSKPGIDVSDAETGARLTCHILLQLFKTPTHPSQVSTSDPSSGDRGTFYLPEAADRHLLAAAQRSIVVGAVLAVLKAIVKLGDSSFSGGRVSTPPDSDAGVTSFLAPIGGLDECDNFGFGGTAKLPSLSGGGGSMCLSDFAKHAVRIICSQQWVRERCLKNIEWDCLMDQELTMEQRQNLIQLICCPEEELQKLAETQQDQRTYVLSVLKRMSRWTLRQTLLELQIMLKEAGRNISLSDDIAKAVIDVFKNEQVESTRGRKSPISGLELDKSSVWLMPPLVSELSSTVQAKVLHEASVILETSQHWSRSRSDRDRQPNRNPASLLSQQPFLTLILTCLKGQDEQRDSLLESLQSQILMFHSDWHSSRQQQHRDISGSNDTYMTQSMVQEALQLRLSLMGGMFDTVQHSSHWTGSVVVLLTQLVNSGMVDVQVNSELFYTVFDMIAVLLHGTLGGDSPNSGEGSKRDYLAIVKKIKKEIGDSHTPSILILKHLLPIPRKDNYVVACEPIGAPTDRQGLQVATKQKIVPWDVIDGLKNPAPLCLSWFGASKTERKEMFYETQQRLLIYHDHDFWQQPLTEYLKPPVLPEEEEEKPPTPKVIDKKRKSTHSSSRAKSPSASPYSSKDMQQPNKRIKPPKKKHKKSQDLTPYMPPRTPNMNPVYNISNPGMMSQPPQQIHNSGMFNQYQMYQSGPMQTNINAGPYMNQSNPQNKGLSHSSYVKSSLAQLIKTKNQPHPQTNQPHGGVMGHQQGGQQTSMNSKSALRSMIQKNMGDMTAPPYGRQTSRQTMAQPMPNMRHLTAPHQQPMGGYNNYVNPQQGGSIGGHPNMIRPTQNYNSYQSGGGGAPPQQQNYHQVMPNQSYMNQQQNPGVAQGYTMGNMQMQGSTMNQANNFNMQGGGAVQNQGGMMGGQQPQQYGMMQQQPGRQMNRMNPQQQMVGGQGGMMQMHSMGQTNMNDPMVRQRQMMGQGMPHSQFVSRGAAPQQQQTTAQLVSNLRRSMTLNQGPMYHT